MYLKSLHLRGFKSFADATRLDFEPGITVIVGPNGSGKSNIVDALTWSMGTRSAKDLRGGSMSDVIFAGAGQRKAMGRAAVEITIDNADEELPIEFSEVTVGRAMFATGENAYSINDVECRQLDVAELLSDTGLGRETHTIVGQGRIDAVLNARPEERRAFIEEAAGILKHRRRKERALRKLGQMEGHLERLVDLLSEMRRQLRPLERQAEAASKHKDLSDQLRGIRTERGLRDLAILLDRWAVEAASRSDSEARLAALEQAIAEQKGQETAIAQGLGELAPAVRAATETQFALANLVERSNGLVERIVERRNGLTEAVEEPIAGRDPEELRAEARADEETLVEVRERVIATGAALETARKATQSAEQARRAHEQAAAAEARRRVEARERQIRWEGEVTALRGQLAQASGEEGRLQIQLQAQEGRAQELESDVAAVQNEIQRLDAAGAELTQHVRDGEERRARAQREFDQLVREERDLERKKASLEARADALLAASADPGEGSAEIVAAAERGELSGVRGVLASLMSVTDGHAVAVSAALGPLAEAVVVENRSAAESAVGFVADAEAGRALLLVGSHPTVEPDQPSEASVGARPLAAEIEAEPGIRAAVRRALAGVYVCDSFATACRLADSRPDLVFVSLDGQIAGARGHAGGGAAGHTAVLSKAAAEEAAQQAEAITQQLRVVHRRVGDAERALGEAREEVEHAQATMAESDAQITSAAERLGRLGKELKRCHAERDQVARSHAELVEQTASRKTRIQEMQDRGPEPHVPDPRFADESAGDVEAERLEDALDEAREAEVQARLEARSAEQEAGELTRRIQMLRSEADKVEVALAEQERRRTARIEAIVRCDELESVARTALESAEQSRISAATERDQLEEARAEQQRRLGVVRNRLTELGEQLSNIRDSRHQEDLVRQELSLQIDGVRARLADIGIQDGEEALEAWDGEDLKAGGEERDQALKDAEERLVRKIGLLGTVNPLALEEFEALKERYEFMTVQLEDLRTSKKDLMRVVEAVDDRIRVVFAEAFDDVAAHFERIFPMLFPGGTGKLILTEPDDMLTTGVEVEARPPGKKVKRLSLLSGGERSLTALAVLFAIFAARPSPFYVLDEVEAALDDANLGRFLTVLEDFRNFSQWIIVTHQRRTMEVADTVYGVSMNRTGVSKVVSQKLSDTGLART